MVDYWAGNENVPTEGNAANAGQQAAAGGEDTGMAEISVSYAPDAVSKANNSVTL